jgi:putative ABC transport system permease protein
MPNWNHIVREHFAVLRLPPEREIEIVEELALHLEAAYEDALADGLSEAEAEARAAQGYDWRLLECELSRAERPLAARALQPPLELIERKGGMRMESFLQDLRFGARILIKQPAFALITTLTLALGIGANTAIFSVVNAVLLRPLPYAQPGQIVAIWDGRGKATPTQGTTAPRNFQWWREQSRSFSDLALTQGIGYRLTETQEAASGVGLEVTPNFFALLGVSAFRGRPLVAGDETTGIKPVVLSYRLWQSAFGADESVIGRSVKLGAEAYTVVGIMPPQFAFPPRISLASDVTAQDCDLWIPLAIDQQRLQAGKNYFAYGRLRNGVTLDQAQSEMSALAPRLQEAFPKVNDQLSIHLAALPELATRQVRPVLSVLLGAVIFILLIACANVANLMLASGAARSRELAIRAALGATRGRALRQILTECALLGLLGGMAGLALAYGGLRLLERIAEVRSPHPLAIDLPVLGFTLALSLVTSILFGSWAAWQMASGAIRETLQEAGRSGAGGVRLGRVRGGLAVAQVALSLMLLIGAGLLIRTLWTLLQVDPGFRAERVLTMDVGLTAKYSSGASVIEAYTEMLERVSHLPGVVSAGATQRLPVRGEPYGESFQIEGRPMRSPGDLLEMQYRVVTPGYFSAMGIPLRQGRLLTEQDTETSPRVVVISERLARLHFPNESPIGRRVTINDPKSGPWEEIVGIVGDVRHWGLDGEPPPEFYVSYRQHWKRFMTFTVKTEGDPLRLAQAVRAEARAFDKDLVPNHVATMEQVISASLTQRRLNLMILGFLATLAVGLAVIGLYGVLAYTVAQRTHEIGIRMALGAERRDILRLMLRQGVLLVALGLALGLLGASAATRALRSMLFGVGPIDLLTFGAITLLLATVALLACYLPARKATKVDPLTALRHE